MAANSRADVAQVLGQLAIEMQDQSDTDSTLRTIVHGAVQIVPGTRWAGISLIEGRSVDSRVPTDPIVAELDGIQKSTNEGPCLSALREHHTVRVEDMANEIRWPIFAKAATERGVRSLLSFQLFVRGENLGVLNLYGAESGVFTDESVVTGEILAQHASVALVGAAAESHLKAAVVSRDVIGQAKGILMQRSSIGGLQAFSLLVRASQKTNVKLIDVARALVAEHEAQLGG